MSRPTARATCPAWTMRRGLRFHGSWTALTESDAQCANSDARLSPSKAISAFQRSPVSFGNCPAHCAWRSSIALADALSLSPGACVAKLALFAVISRQASDAWRSEEHTSELQSLMRISYAVF